ncbi:MAG: cytochrome c3 family protein [Rhodothermales bacterium]
MLKTFETYSSGTLEAHVDQPTGISLVCLSCHDGTMGTDHTVTDPLGTDLRNDHPISFTYDAFLALTDTGLRNPSTTPGSRGGTIATDNLEAGRMECTSCHNVHDNTNGNFLIENNSGSRLCFRCHAK